MKSYEEIQKEIQSLPVKDLFGTKKEIKHLSKIMDENEMVLAITSGLMDGNTWLITCTNRRVIFLDKGLIYGSNQFEIPLDKINAIGHKIGLMLGSITIEDGSGPKSINNCTKQSVIPFVNSTNAAIEKYKNRAFKPSSSDADELIKFKGLLDSGVITQEEFDLKKKSILNI